MFSIAPHLADNPGDRLRTLLYIAASDWLLGLAWRIRGDFTVKCEHVAGGEKPYMAFTLEKYRGKKLLYRARVMLCRSCAAALP